MADDGNLDTAITDNNAVAPRVAAMARVPTGQQPAVATPAAVATVPGNGAAVTADQGDGSQRKEHRQRKSEETLHQEISKRGKPDAADASMWPSETNPDPGRPPDRSKPLSEPFAVGGTQTQEGCGVWEDLAARENLAPRLPAVPKVSRKLGNLRQECRFSKMCGRLSSWVKPHSRVQDSSFWKAFLRVKAG